MTIPRRLVLRILAACLRSQAHGIEARTPGRTARRRGPQAGAGAAGKQQARDHQVADLLYQADVISGWVGELARYQGPEIDASWVGLLAALALGHAAGWKDIKRLVPSLQGADWRDLPAVVDGLFRVP